MITIKNKERWKAICDNINSMARKKRVAGVRVVIPVDLKVIEEVIEVDVDTAPKTPINKKPYLLSYLKLKFNADKVSLNMLKNEAILQYIA